MDQKAESWPALLQVILDRTRARARLTIAHIFVNKVVLVLPSRFGQSGFGVLRALLAFEGGPGLQRGSR